MNNNISFEESLEKLESIVKELESGNIELDHAIDKYTEAMKLVSVCSDKLKNATEQVNKILNANDELIPFEINESE
ncbi:MAG: exodeoxyribonuclease VII small subunit [Bacilli bacterium]|jgi:exodeoxyribonuclease VII small subunit|nr:exodeoxyribonuclease VII small subunit [Bacilli bacterium]